MLDLHFGPSPLTKGPPSLEILEAGTGHGALTLFLARAIHGANTGTSTGQDHPKDPGRICPNTVVEDPSEGSVAVNTSQIQHTETSEDQYGLCSAPKSPYQFKEDRRRAVIHTIDISPEHSKNAKEMITGFRQGIYRGDIQFHVGDVSEWIDQQLVDRESNLEKKAFLSHIILDMPSSHQHVEKAASALRDNGCLVAFNPSITQIISIVEIIKRQYLPLQLDRVVELGPNMTGGREWDVRAAKPRVLARKEREQKSSTIGASGEEGRNRKPFKAESTEIGRPGLEEVDVPIDEGIGLKMVCRPKVGERVIGGGFLGVWKKMRDNSS